MSFTLYHPYLRSLLPHASVPIIPICIMNPRGARLAGELTTPYTFFRPRRPSEAEAAAPHGGRAARTDPPRDHEHWEEKRHQLLLQKLQLEAEKERLQTRLAEQEERLARQGQQLRQSRLDYSRYGAAAAGIW
jgi:1-acyl-sn-glycerol-3-phosphate acyltransferase